MYSEEEHWGKKDARYNGEGIGGTNYTGPGPNIDPQLLGWPALDEMDRSAYNHDVAYYQAHTGGIFGAFFNTSVISADNELIRVSYSVMQKYKQGVPDAVTKLPVSERTYNIARAVYGTFSITTTIKSLFPW